MESARKHLSEIADQGYTIARGVFDGDRAAAMVEALEQIEMRLGLAEGTNGFEGYATVRAYNLLAHGPIFESIPIEPSVLEVVDGVLDDGCLISSLSSIAIGPGEIAQPIHADDQIMPLAKPHVATVCNTMWALTDFTEANGATRVIPGSHLADHNPNYGEHYASIAAEMPLGSVLIWHGSLWHGGGANSTDDRRYGIAMNYCAGWVRQQENQQLGLALDAIRGFPTRLQQMCGFGVYGGLIGHIERDTPARRLL